MAQQSAGSKQEHSATANVLAFASNISSSVLIVFVNKLVMLSPDRGGHGFVWATTLCSLHFFTSAAAVKAYEGAGLAPSKHVPARDLLAYVGIASISIASLNLSLLVNSVGFYQISKLLIIPFVCCVETLWLGKRYSWPALAAMLLVVIGVGIVTVTDVSVRLLGLLMASISVVSSGLQQILCGTTQADLAVTPVQLLSNAAPLQGCLLLLVGPAVDRAVTGRWVWGWSRTITVGGAAWLAVSCAVAVLVNVSQFVCLGRFTALTFQVLGHAKTILVLLVGWLYLGDALNPRVLAGMALAVLGMVLYGCFTSKPSGPPKGEATNGPPPLPVATKQLAASYKLKVSPTPDRDPSEQTGVTVDSPLADETQPLLDRAESGRVDGVVIISSSGVQPSPRHTGR